MPTLTKRGFDGREAIRYARCGRCKSEYEFKHSEKEVTLHFDQRDGDYYCFRCEVCKEMISIDERVSVRKPMDWGKVDDR